MGTTAVTPAGRYTAQLVRQYFPSSVWDTMVAIADAESNFNPQAINQSSGATGLFQIEYWLHGLTQAEALNPVTNTRTAAKMYSQSGLQPWAGDGYQSYLGIAHTLVNLAAPAVHTPRPAVVVVAPSFTNPTGSAHVTSGGHILGTLVLTAKNGTVPYKVVMAVSPTYGSRFPTSTTTTGSATNTTVKVNQSLVAPLPDPQLLRNHSGPMKFAYTVSWVVTDTKTGASHTITAAHKSYLTVQ